MSHVEDIALKCMNLETLGQVATRLGLELRQQSTYRWYGEYMGDYKLPEGMTRDQLGKCDYALTIPGDKKAYEVGIVSQPDGSYRLLWDFWNGGYGLQDKIGEDGFKLIQGYAEQEYKNLSVANGAVNFMEATEADGTRVVYAVYN